MDITKIKMVFYIKIYHYAAYEITKKIYIYDVFHKCYIPHMIKKNTNKIGFNRSKMDKYSFQTFN